MGWGTLAAAAVGGIASAFGASQQNKANRAAAGRQMDFQAEMSNTSYQRGMEDMRLAGLNPILAYKQGGASTPGGAAIPQQNVLGQGVSAGLQSAQAAATTQLTEQQARERKALADRAEIQNLAYSTALEAMKSERAKKAGKGLRKAVQGALDLTKQTPERQKAWKDREKQLRDPDFHNKYFGKKPTGPTVRFPRANRNLSPSGKGIY